MTVERNLAGRVNRVLGSKRHMRSQFIDKKIDYDGSQLKSHWIFDMTGVLGDTVVSFIGGCDVSLDHMVDLVDKKNKCKIFSKKMLHFILEHFDTDIEKAILRQRLFVSIMAQILKVERRGNDLYDGDAKINVSIATASAVSSLIHVGVNIVSDGTPVKTKGLNDYNIDPKIFAEDVMKRYISEMEGVAEARCKVRGVI